MKEAGYEWDAQKKELKKIESKKLDMTREEEIINAAYNEAEVERQLKMHPQVFEQGFVAGAKWADAHPDIDVRTMAAWQSGYNEAIERACEYLEEYTPQKFEDVQNYVENFLKAMKGGEG